MVSLQLLFKQEVCLTKASNHSVPWPTLELWVAQCWEVAAWLFLGWKGLWYWYFPATFWAQSLLTLLLIIATKRNLPSFEFAYFVFSKVYVVISFMAETGSISECRDTSFMKFPFRGNSDGWALTMQRFQVIDNHYLVLCMKKKVISCNTREEVKLSCNHSRYLNSSYTFTWLTYPIFADWAKMEKEDSWRNWWV